jgi:hypothetical protein
MNAGAQGNVNWGCRLLALGMGQILCGALPPSFALASLASLHNVAFARQHMLLSPMMSSLELHTLDLRRRSVCHPACMRPNWPAMCQE